MNAQQDAAERLWWGVRRWWWLAVLAVALAVGVAVSAPAGNVLDPDREYRATALVVATQLAIRPEQLPRTAEAVFVGGTVAEDVVDGLDLTTDPSALIPDHVRLEPLVDTIALRIIGIDEDPDRAVDLADAAAFSFVRELNELGPGVGVFELKDQARRPLESDAGASVVPLAVGAIAGTALAVGLIGLLLVLRRPVLDLHEAATVTASPVIAVIDLPARRRMIQPESVGGLGLLARRLFPGGKGVAVVVGSGRDDRVRAGLVAVMSQLLARSGPVYVVTGDTPLTDVPEDADITVVQRWWLDRAEASGPSPVESRDAAVVISVSAAEYDVPQLVPPGAKAVLVVVQGARRSRVESAAGQFGTDDLTGVAFIRTRAGLRSGRRREGSRAVFRPSASTPRPARRDVASAGQRRP